MILIPVSSEDSTIAFKMYCGFSNGTKCHMSNCSQSGSSWEMVTRADGGPSSDHTSLPSGNSTHQGEFSTFQKSFSSLLVVFKKPIKSPKQWISIFALIFAKKLN